MVWSLAAERVVEGKVESVLLDQWLFCTDVVIRGRVKLDYQSVQIKQGYVHFISPEHVVTLQDFLAVQKYLAMRVESFKNQKLIFGILLIFCGKEIKRVSAVFRFIPVCLEEIVSVVKVWLEDTVLNQNVNGGWWNKSWVHSIVDSEYPIFVKKSCGGFAEPKKQRYAK